MKTWQLLLVVVCIVTTSVDRAPAAAQYRLTDLGSFEPDDINSFGQIVGNSPSYSGLLTPGGYTATPIDLGFADDDGELSINGGGQVASGAIFLSTNGLEFWTPTVTNGASGSVTEASDPYVLENPRTTDIGNDGTLIGSGWDFSNGGGHKSFVWKPSSPNGATGVTHSLGGGNGASVHLGAINDRGNIAGTDATGAFVFIPNVPNGIVGTSYPLGTNAMALTSRSSAVNDVGQIVGEVVEGIRRHAMIWTPTTVNGSTGTIVDLGLMPGRLQSYAVDINNQGVAIGVANDNSTTSGSLANLLNGLTFLWNPADGMVNLETLLDASGAGWRLYSVSAINDKGQIVGIGMYDPDGPGGVAATPRGFVLNVVPEPSAIALLLMSLCGWRMTGLKRGNRN